MPDTVRKQFELMGCTVAQSHLSSQPHNVLHGEFATPGQEDWMIACLTADGQVQPLFVWGGANRCEGELSGDMLLRMQAGSAHIDVVPYLTVAAPREGETHDRILQRWSPTGIWSYSCANGKWETSEAASCKSSGSDGRVPSANALRIVVDGLEWRRDIKTVASQQLNDELSKLVPGHARIQTTAIDCAPNGNLQQRCVFQLMTDPTVTADIMLKRVGKDLWFVSRSDVIYCELK